MNGDGPQKYLLQMREAGSRAVQFVEDMDLESFLQDLKTQSAVGMCLVIIGEAAMQLTENHPDFVVDHPEMPLNAMRGMGNLLAHGYLSVDLMRVWDTVQTSVPDLLVQVQSVLHWRAEGE